MSTILFAGEATFGGVAFFERNVIEILKEELGKF